MVTKTTAEPAVAAGSVGWQASDWVGLGQRGATAELRRVLASVRVLLAIIAGLSMLDSVMANGGAMSIAVLAFLVYAGWLFWLELRGSSLPDSHPVYWADAAWCLLLLASNGVSQSIFSIFVFFPVLFTALRWGPRYGTLFAVILAGGVLALLFPWSQQRLAGHGTTLPIALVVLGPLTAVLARTGASLGRRLTLARELAREADPRLGLESVGRTVLQHVCDEFRADVGILVFTQPGGTTRVFRCQDGGRARVVPRLTAEGLVQQLLPLPAGLTATYSDAGPGLARFERYNAYDLDEARPVKTGREDVAAIAYLIECPSLVTTPVAAHGQIHGRLVIGRRGGRRLDARDADFLCHVMEQVLPILENAALLERLAADAAEHERTRIGRDLHDSAIQPYIGLKFAIEALARRVPANDPLAADVGHLAQMASEELAALRDLVSGLRSGARRSDGALMPSVRRQAARFAELFGIAVEVNAEGELPVSRQLAGELFHMVSEGLSNIRRHSRASRAWISLRAEADLLVLQISNDHGNEAAPPPLFRPRSLSERAEALGGTLAVAVTEKRQTSVVVRIPLEQ